MTTKTYQIKMKRGNCICHETFSGNMISFYLYLHKLKKMWEILSVTK